MFIYYAFVFFAVLTDVIGGGGVVCIIGRLNPGVGRPTGKPGTGFETVLSKSYGLFVGFVSAFVYFFLSFFILCSFFFVFSLDEELDEPDESELLEELE